MKIRRYTADDFQTAMARAKLEMGKDAILLNTRQFKEGGFLGLFGRKKVEITVAVDDDARVITDLKKADDELPKEQLNPQRNKEAALLQQEEKSEEEAHKNAGKGGVGDFDEADAASKELLNEIAAVKDMVDEIRTRMNERDVLRGFSRSGRAVYQRLVSAGVEEKLAVKMVKTADQKASEEGVDVENAGYQILINYLRNPRPIELSRRSARARVVMLIGPTGVGKTTTIAKLAANYGLTEGKKVALVTVDTYRIAAVEQLKTYAEIIGIPCEVVFHPSDMKKALEKHFHRDLILIDTAGRSPKNQEHIAELADYIKEANPDEIMLVISATTRNEDIMDIYRSFNTYRVDKLIFTKVDETSNYGVIVNTVHKTKTPLAYITNGQSVPDDIKVPEPEELARFIWGDDITS